MSLVLDESFDLGGGTVTVNADGYAVLGKRLLHRVVKERELGRKLATRELVDHRNGNRLDARTDNLRVTTLQGNALNRNVPERGVFWSKRYETWNFAAVVSGVSVAFTTKDKGLALHVSEDFWSHVVDGTDPELPKTRELLERLKLKSLGGGKKYRGITRLKSGKFYARVRVGDGYVNGGVVRGAAEEAARDYDELLRKHRPDLYLINANHFDEVPDFSEAVALGDHLGIPLPGGRIALVDAEDHDKIKPYRFGLGSGGYVQGRLMRPCDHPDLPARIALHRYLMGTPDDEVVDHTNGKLDNRKGRLKNTTYTGNCVTSNRPPSKFGMKYIRPRSKNSFGVRFTRFGKTHTKNFTSLGDAVAYRDQYLTTETI